MIAPEPAGPEVPPADVVAWMREAGAPFLDWLLGDEVDAIVGEWILRDSSELSLRHVDLVLREGRCVAGLSALSGAQLARSRVADMQALMKRQRSPAEQNALMERLRRSRTWFLPVPADELYVTKVGVLPEYRGRGLAKQLLRRALIKAVDTGLVAVRLDVAASNAPALGLYRACGLEPIGEVRTPELNTSYVALRCEVA
jgi:ribosomal protein S18 acetylase RimI-like enzyme